MTVSGTAEVTLAAAAATAEIRSELAGSVVSGSTTLAATGHADVSGPTGSLSATVLAGTPMSTQLDPTAAGLPATLTVDEIAALNGGRLPVGVRSAQPGQDPNYRVSYTDTVTPTVTVDSASGVVLGLDLRLVRTVQVNVPDRGPVSAGTVLDVPAAATAAGRRRRLDRGGRQRRPADRPPGRYARSFRACWSSSPSCCSPSGCPS